MIFFARFGDHGFQASIPLWSGFNYHELMSPVTVFLPLSCMRRKHSWLDALFLVTMAFEGGLMIESWIFEASAPRTILGR